MNGYGYGSGYGSGNSYGSGYGDGSGFGAYWISIAPSKGVLI